MNIIIFYNTKIEKLLSRYTLIKNMPPTYEKLDQIEHIHKRSDMYVGSLKPKREENEWISNTKCTSIKKTDSIKYSQGLLRIFVEAISNAIDNVWRSQQANIPCKQIKITINKESGETTIINDGLCIPVEKQAQTGLYNPELIFGHLLTSSNYNDNEDRYTSGRNGLGIKLANVFSKKFSICVADGKKKYTKTWTNNMRQSDPETICSCKNKGFTQVSWIPDFEKFKMTGYDNNIIRIYHKIILDTAMITKVNVFLNDEKIHVKSILDYAKCYKSDTDQYIQFKSDDCEVVLTMNDTGEDYEYIPFTNGVYNRDGGIHVDKWTEAIFRPIIQKINKPKKPQITMKDVKKFFRIFINCTVKNPEFTSQSKTCLSHPEVHTDVKPSNITNIMKWPVIDEIRNIIRGKELLTLKKTETRRKKYVKIDGFDPANHAGTKKSKDCTLILCEGLSAKTYAISGIQVGWNGKKGRDWFGAYALRGKLLNVRNSNMNQISKNKEIADLVNALNLKYDIDYTIDKHFETLNYGQVMIMTDADHDGIHIASLIINVFHFLFPSLLKRPQPFLITMQTPIIKILNKNIVFYRDEHYERYLEQNQQQKLKIKYYKGLGTSSDKEIKDTFGQYVIKFNLDDVADKTLNLVFNNKQADDRKKWMTHYEPSYPEENIQQLSITDYLNTEQIKFSISDCGRSLPNIYDGMKESHRKIMYAILLKKPKESIKVAQLAGFVAEKTNYHHGEQNLFETITKLAQDFVGSNNISYLIKDGQFGTRLAGGKDAANARYIFTNLSPITRMIYPEADDVLLDMVIDEGETVEPKYYIPIIPMILVNGCKAGIGTGWSTSIPSYNPIDIINCIKHWLTDKPIPELIPWYRGFNGTITKTSQDKFETTGVFQKVGKKIIITELPIMTWTDKFKEYCEGLLENKKIKSLVNHSTPEKVHFEITQNDDMTCDENTLKLKTTLSTSNMVLFKDDMKLKKYNTIQEIITDFCGKRYNLYEKRKEYLLKMYSDKLHILKNKWKFIDEVNRQKIQLYNTPIDTIINILETKQYYKKDECYDYLLNLNIRSFTKEKLYQIQQDIEQTQQQHQRLQSTSVSKMWIDELNELQKKI